MLKKKLTLILLFFTICNSLFSQSWEFGVGLQNMNFKGKNVSFNSSENPQYFLVDTESEITFAKLIGGVSFPIFSFSEEFNLGANISTAVGGPLSGSGSVTAPNVPIFCISVPTYVTLKYGAGSNIEAWKKIGFGFGIGYQYSAFFSTIESAASNENGTYYYFHPNLSAEISIDQGRRKSGIDNSKFKFEIQLGKHNHLKHFNELEYGFNFQQFSISYIHFFDYK